MMASLGHNAPPPSEMAGNWIAISRDIRDHPIVGFGQPMKPSDPKRGSYSRAEAWMDLLMEARWQDGQVNNKGKVVTLLRGQLMAARSWLAARWNWTENAVRWFLDKLEKDSMVRKDHHHSNPKERRHYANVLVIENYDLFQAASELLGLMEARATTNQPPINHQSTTNQPPESNKETKKQDTTPTAPPPFDRGRESLDRLQDKLLAACNGAAANPAACPAILSMAEPIRWIENGCDLELDVLATIRERAHRMAPQSVRNWRYFSQAVADAKAAREAPMPEGQARADGKQRSAWVDHRVERALTASRAARAIEEELLNG